MYTSEIQNDKTPEKSWSTFAVRYQYFSSLNDIQSKLSTTTTLETPKLWPLVTGGSGS
jgi:hypothetical protein